MADAYGLGLYGRELYGARMVVVLTPGSVGAGTSRADPAVAISMPPFSPPGVSARTRVRLGDLVQSSIIVSPAGVEARTAQGPEFAVIIRKTWEPSEPGAGGVWVDSPSPGGAWTPSPPSNPWE